MSFADAFQKYIKSPEKFPSIIKYHDDNVIIIRDLFPKSVCHYLVIPRSNEITHIHPLDAFYKDYSNITGQELYDLMETYVTKAKDLIIEDLKGMFNKCELNNLKLQEFKNSFIKVGVHSIPSLRNLHIHVITSDFESPSMKHKKHYNSFNTDFFVGFDKLNPMLNKRYQTIVSRSGPAGGEEDYASDSTNSEDDNIYDDYGDDQIEYVSHIRNEGMLMNIIKQSPLKCQSCGKSFGNKFQELKKHLHEEYLTKYGQFDNFDHDNIVQYYEDRPR
ncbi:histidine triad superfamily, third branch [Scheffersomyces coipomensis]|uniref:histidine triad superfamily, third branch n=1 Tax=Scheffersomyces coipomensis TaxID=1788519 RepID=UPI00315CBEC1